MTTYEASLWVVATVSIINAVVGYLEHRHVWRAINEIRRNNPRTDDPRQSGERRVIRPGGSPDVRTIDDSGEHVKPSKPYPH